MAYTPGIAMYLALVKGSMLAEVEPRKALAMLDRARLLAPGTLVEEAALRRSIAVATTLGDAQRFLRLSEQYVRTYLRSPYASQFADAFVAGIVTLNGNIDLQAVVDVAALMEPEQVKVVYLRIARRAAIDGLIDLAAFAATHADGVEDDPRAELYSSLSSVTSGTVGDVLADLSRIDRNRLSESDRQLLDAAGAITREMTGAPAGMKPDEARNEPAKVRTVGPEPLTPAAHDNASRPRSRGRTAAGRDDLGADGAEPQSRSEQGRGRHGRPGRRDGRRKHARSSPT